MSDKKIFSGVLLASDFDATLTNDKGEIVPANIDAINYFIENGGLFTVSTGRTKQGFVLYENLPLNAPVLHGNGVMSYDYRKKEVVAFDGISEKALPFIDALASAFPNKSIEMYGLDFSTVCLNTDENSRRHFSSQGIRWTETDNTDNLPFPLVKIMLSVVGCGDEVAAYLADNLPGNLKYIYGGDDFIEIISLTAGKGNGIKALSQALHLDITNVYAIGDGINDVDMLGAVRSFCPVNGHPVAVATADILVDDNNKGAVASAIKILETFYS